MDFEETTLARFLQSRRPHLEGKIVELRAAAEVWLSLIPNTFPHYTSHTVHHSDEIVTQISKLIFERDDPEHPVVPLSPMEAYVLAAAAYLHDVGMVVSDGDKARILVSEEWKKWIESGGGAQRWHEIQTFRQGDNPADEAKRNFLADVQVRYLIAEFVRRTHHLRSVDLLVTHEADFGGFGLGDPILLRTISDVCASHGLRQHELEDKDRYPERRDIQGDTVNVRFLALLLRLGDLLDMSHDRACPLLLNGVCPLPPDSLAHWTKYQCLTHSLTSPERIERTAECGTQDEHRYLQDWCKWLENEVANARILMSRAERHGEWRAPDVRVHPETGSIKIRPARCATYIPSDWNFKLDEEELFQRLVKDVYDHPHAYIRELAQNALDATRCQLYLDLRRDGLGVPDYATQVDGQRRLKYPLRISLEHTEVLNELSGETERRPLLVIEDCGIGMDKQIIRDYFLQVGRSFYKTEEFRRNFRFVPASRFGVGFLSAFAVSNHIVVETYKPSSPAGDGPIRLVLTGPRGYLLMEKGKRRSAGTRIEVILQESVNVGELAKIVAYWCPRVEFPIVVNDFGVESTITAEGPERFAYEAPDVTEAGSRFVVRWFGVDRPGIEGELYVFAVVTGRGESWASWSWAEHTYPSLDPRAGRPAFPEGLTCFQGVRVSSDMGYPHGYGGGPTASRLDYRSDRFRLPLARRRPYSRESVAEDAGTVMLMSRWEEIVAKHLATTECARGDNGWRYKLKTGP